MITALLKKDQLTIKEARQIIDSDHCTCFDVLCKIRITVWDGYHVSSYAEYAEFVGLENAKLKEFIQLTPNHGSYWLIINDEKRYQLLNEDREPH